MSEFDAACLDMDDALFDAFADSVTVQRGVDAAVPVRVVFTSGVQKLGDYGQVVAVVRTAAFRNVDWVAQQGDLVTLPEGGSRRIDAPESNDGFVNVWVLHG